MYAFKGVKESVWGALPQTRLKRFHSILCDAYAVVIRLDKSNRGFNDTFAIRIDEALVVAQTCKTSDDGASLCVFRCANKSVKRVECFCCHSVYPLYSLPFQAVNVLGKPLPSRQDGLYHTKKTFCKSFFQKTQKSFAWTSRKTFKFGTNFAYTITPFCKSDIISSYSSLFILFIGCNSISLNITYPEQSDILIHKLLFNNLLFMF